MISIQHPITYESYNICEMSTASKLSRFSIAINVTGHLQALRNWHLKYKAEKEAAIHRLAGRIVRLLL